MLASALLLTLLLPTKTLDGKPLKPFQFEDAKASVWIFVGTECPISNAYAPEYNRLTKEFTSKGVKFLLVYSDPTEKPDAALKHWKSFHLAAPGTLDPKQELMRKAGATKTPEAAVFDPSGELVYRGRIDDCWSNLGVRRSVPLKRDLKRVLNAMIEGRKGKFPFTETVGCFIPTE